MALRVLMLHYYYFIQFYFCLFRMKIALHANMAKQTCPQGGAGNLKCALWMFYCSGTNIYILCVHGYVSKICLQEKISQEDQRYVDFYLLFLLFCTSLRNLVTPMKHCYKDSQKSFFIFIAVERRFPYVSLRLRVQNAVPAQPCVGKLGISLVLLNFLHCNFRLWFKTP